MAEHSKQPSGALAGRWHLVAAECPEDQIPQHRVDLVFHDEPDGVRGAVLSRGDGSEIPLQAVAFSGAELRLKMSAPRGQPAADSPFLVMTPVADRFEGGWDTPGTEHIRLKLIRARR
jgi:hypothetical protein